MEEKYSLLATVLKELRNAGVLKELILAGSWCQYYYRILFNMSPEIPLIRTTDIDFLVPTPRKISKSLDVAKLLNNIGFDNDFDYQTGLIKFVHPDLEIQFITPALGRGKDKPYEIKQFNINAEGLRYLTLLQDHKFQMIHEDIALWLPEPGAYILHKTLVSRKRKNAAKREKDMAAVRDIGELCLRYEHHKKNLKSIFSVMPLKWQKQVLKTLIPLSSEIHSFLSDG